MGKFSNFLVRELRDFVQPEEELNIPLKPQNDDPLPMNYVWIKFTKSNPIFQGKSPFQKLVYTKAITMMRMRTTDNSTFVYSNCIFGTFVRFVSMDCSPIIPRLLSS